MDPENLKIVKGENLLKLYQYHTKVAEHYFCSKCGIYTHTNPRSNPKSLYGINVACIEGVKPFELENVKLMMALIILLIKKMKETEDCFFESKKKII